MLKRIVLSSIIFSLLFCVTAIPVKVNAGDIVDVAITISADKNSYAEGQIISYEITYFNRIDTPAKEPVIMAQIPENTTIIGSSGDRLGDYLKEGNDVKFILDTIQPFASGKITYQVKVNEIAQPEVVVTNKARILTRNTVNGIDDQSIISVVLFSNRFEQVQQHTSYIKGYNDNTFRPSNNVTRAEVSTILARAINLKATDLSTPPFKDIPGNHWAYQYIIAIKNEGIFTGHKDETFGPDETITREELAVAIFRALKLPDVIPVKYHFTDITKDTWSKNYIEEVYRLKIISGYKDGSFKPNLKVTRAEMAAIINRMLYRGPLLGAEMTFSDVPKSHWAYGIIAESTIDHTYKRRPGGGEMVYIKK